MAFNPIHQDKRDSGTITPSRYLDGEDNSKQGGGWGPDFSLTDSSRAGDRRTQPPHDPQWDVQRGGNPDSSNAAPSRTSPFGDLWRPGSPEPNSFLRAPFTPINMVGDNSDQKDAVHEINIFQYGDAYDPKAAFRVQQVSVSWDPDQDGDI